MMTILYKDDAKKKYQSCEAQLEHNVFAEMGNGYFDITGYGATKEEARANLVILLNDYVNKLTAFAEQVEKG